LPIKIQVHERVRAYQRALPPESRRAAKVAILGLPRGDIKSLTEDLEGLYRLRVGRHRFIWRYDAGGTRVFYAAPRRTVYEYLAAHLREVFGES
jgi:mRNA-degrading endonuclease RelE of RelBE toxin-antitoxin system